MSNDTTNIPQPVQNKIALVTNLEVLQLLRPPALHSGKLRACGIRIVLDPDTRTALELLASRGNEPAEMLAGNSFKPDHPEITRGQPKVPSKSVVLAKVCAWLCELSLWPGRAARPEWISVNDKLPEPGVRVLGFDGEDIEFCQCGQFWGKDHPHMWAAENYGYDGESGKFNCTHWMPVPAAPTK